MGVARFVKKTKLRFKSRVYASRCAVVTLNERNLLSDSCTKKASLLKKSKVIA